MRMLGSNIHPLSPLAVELMQVGTEAVRTLRLMSVADYCGRQERHDGSHFEMWTTRQQVGDLTKGTTVARSTLEAHLFPKDPA